MGKLDLLGGTAKGSYKPVETKPVWMAAKDLKPGDTVITVDGRTATVKAVEPAEGHHTVYNFAVEDHHTYFVGEKHGVLVHNQYAVADSAGAEDEPNSELQPTEVPEDIKKQIDEINADILEFGDIARDLHRSSGELQKLEKNGFLSDQATALREVLYPTTILTEGERQDFNNEERQTLIEYLVAAEDSAGAVDIYFGGAGDGNSNNGPVKYFHENSLLPAGDRLPVYFQQDQGALALAFSRRLDNVRELNLIGHSYGGAAAVQLAKNLQEFGNRQISTLIGVDPVSKPFGSFTPNENHLSYVDYVVHVDLTGGGFFNINNFIERNGKRLGGGIPDVFRHSADVRIEHNNFDHAYFFDGFTTSDPTGNISVPLSPTTSARRSLSARDLLLGIRPKP